MGVNKFTIFYDKDDIKCHLFKFWPKNSQTVESVFLGSDMILPKSYKPAPYLMLGQGRNAQGGHIPSFLCIRMQGYFSFLEKMAWGFHLFP